MRRLHLSSEAKYCVSDDAAGALYVAQEAVGIWRYDADPEAEPVPTLVDANRLGAFEQLVAIKTIRPEFAQTAAVRAMFLFGIGLRYPNIVQNSGPATLSWGPPRWTTRGEAPRILQKGDLMQAELMPMCGNQEVQVQMTVALDPLSETNRTCERVARECYDLGVKALRPGMALSRMNSMQVRTARVWCRFPW